MVYHLTAKTESIFNKFKLVLYFTSHFAWNQRFLEGYASKELSCLIISIRECERQIPGKKLQYVLF